MTNETKRPRGRPRREGADEEILAIALTLLGEQGYAVMTVDEVATRAGLAKTTIYRRWPSKGALVGAAIAPLLADESPLPDSRSLEADLTVILGQTIALLGGEFGTTMAAIIGDSQLDPTLHDVVSAMIEPHRKRLREILERDRARGRLRRDIDVELFVDLLTGPLWTRLLITRARFDGSLAAELVTSVIAAS